MDQANGRDGKSQLPVAIEARIPELDALRGIALLGILAANVRQMFLPWDIGNFPVPPDGSRLAWLDWRAFHALIDLKFLTLFSLLFGIGFALQSERLAARGAGFNGLYLRRVAILAAFGIAHALLLYPAEVLLPYAVTALLLLVAQRLSAESMLRVGLLLLGTALLWGYQLGSFGRVRLGLTALAVVAMAASVSVVWRKNRWLALGAWATVLFVAGCALTLQLGGAAAPLAEEYREAQQQWATMQGSDASAWPQEFRVRRAGTFGGLVELHAHQYAQILIYFVVVLLWRTLGVFMIGAGLFRNGSISRSTPRSYRRIAIVGLCSGLPLSLCATWFYGRETQGFSIGHFSEFLHAYAALPLTAGIAGSVFALYRGRHWLWQRIEAAGRMALSNYVGQSLVVAAIAEPWGLGLYGRLNGPLLTVLALSVFMTLAWLSHAWLERFRMGPLEWLWRCGTYGRWLPNRSAVTAT